MILLLACVAGDTGTDTKSDAEVDPFCEGEASVSYESFGKGFLTENCNTCHSASGDDRNGAPDDVRFDTISEVWTQSSQIIAAATGPAPVMPPEGGVSEDDRHLLEVWLRCATPGE